ncbi:MAG TPA: hypothetical protein VN493_11875 [Thermoanaerobaculia bacterium]|nr:hypothetical protein [Thermoanaerobaculia bacterium]
MAETPITSLENQNEESEEQSQVDFVVDPISEEDLEDVSGGAGCVNCSNGCSET